MFIRNILVKGEKIKINYLKKYSNNNNFFYISLEKTYTRNTPFYENDS